MLEGRYVQSGLGACDRQTVSLLLRNKSVKNGGEVEIEIHADVNRSLNNSQKQASIAGCLSK
jgi:uncharacterized OsmC-like protein